MKNIIFPFRKNYSELKTHWWHRLLIVAFTISVFFAGVLTWQSSNQSDMNSYSNCLKLEMAIYDSSNSPNADQQWKTGQKECSDSFNETSHPILNLIIGIITAIVTFYLLQVIYYKIVLYIAYGRKIGN